MYLLTFDTQYELCMSFVRMQEFYESPSNKFRGKYFTLEEYIDYWSLKFGKGSFTYPSVWSGFNIPGKVLLEWLRKFIGNFSDERGRETAVFKEIGKLMDKEFGDRNPMPKCLSNFDKIYVIAVHDQDDEVDSTKDIIAHETAHALYSLYPEYKDECDKLLKDMPKKEIKADSKALLGMGYCKELLKDELQAYYSWKNDTINVRSEFVNNFRAFKKGLKNGRDANKKD